MSVQIASIRGLISQAMDLFCENNPTQKTREREIRGSYQHSAVAGEKAKAQAVYFLRDDLQLKDAVWISILAMSCMLKCEGVPTDAHVVKFKLHVAPDAEDRQRNPAFNVRARRGKSGNIEDFTRSRVPKGPCKRSIRWMCRLTSSELER